MRLIARYAGWPMGTNKRQLARGYRRGKWRARPGEPVAIVVHSTGGGPHKRLRGDRFERWRRRHLPPGAGPLEAAVAIYASVMDAGPHYVVGQCGGVIQVAPTSVSAWHVGASRMWRYKWWHVHHPRAHAWWAARHPELSSPLDMPEWRTGSANDVTIGVEVVPPGDDVRERWSLCALDAIERLARRHELPITTHADLHPIQRTRRGVPWDPPPAPLAQLDELAKCL